MFFSPAPGRRRLQLQISERKLVLAMGDASAVLLSVLFALRIWASAAREPFTLAFVLPQSLWFFILVGLWLLLASANDLYDLRIAASRTQSFQRLVYITLQMLIVYLVIFFLSPRDALPRLFILYYGITSFVLIGIWRFTRPFLMGWASEPRRVLIIGTDWAAQTIISVIERYALNEYDVKGIIGEVADVGSVMHGIPIVGTSKDLQAAIHRDRITELVITSTRELSGDMFQAVMDAYEHGLPLVPMPLLYERITGRVPVEHVDNNWAVVLPLDGTSIFNPYPTLKRLMDVVLSVLGMIVFLLLLPILALIIRVDSPGNIFYSQERVGRNGRVFRIYKFRSMVQNAEASTGAVFSRQGDNRVTRVGRIMRRTRLDELPQLVNVIRGDMSLIGPRPERPEHVTRLTEKIPFYRTRLIIRPGLTGWAQVRYNYGSDDEDALIKLQYDLYYIRHQSLMLDFNILLRTVGKVLAMKGV